MRKNVLVCDVTGAEFESNEAEQQLVGFITNNDGTLQATNDVDAVDIHICVDVITSIHSFETQRLAIEAAT